MFSKISKFIPAVISAILVVLSFPKTELYLLMWVALIPFFMSIVKCEPKTAFKQGFVFGLFYFFGTLWWISHSITHYGGFNIVFGLFLILVLCGYLSLYPAIFSYLTSMYIKKTKLPFSFIAPVLWVSLDYLKTYLLTGFPWNSLGYSQYKFLPIIQISDITGVYGVTFLIVAVNSIVIDVYLLKKRQEEKPLFPVMPTYAGYCLVGLALIFSLIYGIYKLNSTKPTQEITVSVIQGNIDQSQKWDVAFQRYVIDVYKALTLSAIDNKTVNLVIWPETSLPFVYDYDQKLTTEINSLAMSTQTYLLVGTMMQKKINGEYYYTNSAILLDPQGKPTYRYDKIHLVPFGEYVPLKKILFFIDKLAYTAGEYIAGDGYIKALSPFGNFATLICYEIIFPGLTRKFFTKGGDFIVNITNDAWFGDTPGPYQHFAMAVFRAVENRKVLIRSANTGISGFINSKGEIIDKSNTFVRQYLSQKLTIDKTLTFYSKYGDIFSYFCILMSLFLFTKRLK